MGGEKIVAGLIAAAGAHWVLGCSRERLITVGSKNFTEQVILGEIVAQHVSLRLSGTGGPQAEPGRHAAGASSAGEGDLDLYPEYTGTALTASLNAGFPPTRRRARQSKAEYLSRFKFIGSIRWDSTIPSRW